MTYYEVDICDVEFYEKLGAGTFGSVYRALWKSRQKIVAVKKLLVLEKEPEVLSTLSHRHIVQFYGACTAAPDYCIITEYAELGSLFQYLQDNQIDFGQILLWAKQIIMGLNYLHTEAPIPVIHRDLKSKNVVIAADRSAKICDFGSSKFHMNTTKMTLTGTFPWMSPEMIQEQPVSASTDVFSYGVVLWELLTHEVPFRGLEGISVAWLVVGRGVRLTIPESCPEPFSQLMKKCWETDPLKRPTCKEILAKLDHILGNEQLQAQTDSFINNKDEWKKEIDDKMAQLKAMERQLSDKEKELDEREKALKEKEKKFKEKIKTKPLETHDVAFWTEEDVADWVYDIGHSENGPGEIHVYAELFKDNHISGRRLFLLTADDLLQIGIFSVGHRREILKEIDDLKFDNDRLLHFPPLPGTAPLKAPPRHRSHSIKAYPLTLVYGNLCRKGRTPEVGIGNGTNLGCKLHSGVEIGNVNNLGCKVHSVGGNREWELSGCDCMYSGILLFTLYTHRANFHIVNPSQSGLTSFNISQNLHPFCVL
jgi:sterile alpha motif and leucine zipper-containing kinase AZK